MGCFNRYKARGCSYTKCKSKHMFHTLALWSIFSKNRPVEILICVSFKWVVLISTKQEAAHTQRAKVNTCSTLWHFGVFFSKNRPVEILIVYHVTTHCPPSRHLRGTGYDCLSRDLLFIKHKLVDSILEACFPLNSQHFNLYI